MADPIGGTNRLDVLKASFWPIIALLTVFLFSHPLKSILSHVGDNLGTTQEIDAGPLKLQFSAARAQQIPPPSPEVADALSKLDSNTMDELLSLKSNAASSEMCLRSGVADGAPEGSIEQAINYDELIHTKLVVVEDAGQNSIPFCKDGSVKFARLSPAGLDARRYLLKLITQSVLLSKT